MIYFELYLYVNSMISLDYYIITGMKYFSELKQALYYLKTFYEKDQFNTYRMPNNH